MNFEVGEREKGANWGVEIERIKWGGGIDTLLVVVIGIIGTSCKL